MAYIHKHGDGWRAQVAKMGVRRTAVWPTKREATEWATRVESEISAGRFSKYPQKTLEQAVTKYLTSVTTTKRNAEAWERRRFAALCEHFGPIDLADITSEMIGEWRDKRLETVTGSTVVREVNLYRNLFKIAVEEWKWLEKSPFQGVRLPKENAPRHQRWTWQLIKRMLRAGQRTGGKTQEVTEAFHISLRTGMRLNEALAAPALLDRKRRVLRMQTKMRMEEIPVGRLAFKLVDRPPFTVGPNEASTLFSKLRKAQLIEGLTLKDARATALTMLAKKVDILTLARISRHKNIDLLRSTYYRETAEEIARRI